MKISFVSINTSVTLESQSNYFLTATSTLANAVGSARTSIDVAAGAKCSAYKTFGIWNITL